MAEKQNRRQALLAESNRQHQESTMLWSRLMASVFKPVSAEAVTDWLHTTTGSITVFVVSAGLGIFFLVLIVRALIQALF